MNVVPRSVNKNHPQAITQWHLAMRIPDFKMYLLEPNTNQLNKDTWGNIKHQSTLCSIALFYLKHLQGNITDSLSTILSFQSALHILGCFWDPWVAQSVKCLTSAQVMISGWSWSQGPGVEPCSGLPNQRGVCLSLCPSMLFLSMCVPLSQINKWIKIF